MVTSVTRPSSMRNGNFSACCATRAGARAIFLNAHTDLGAVPLSISRLSKRLTRRSVARRGLIRSALLLAAFARRISWSVSRSLPTGKQGHGPRHCNPDAARALRRGPCSGRALSRAIDLRAGCFFALHHRDCLAVPELASGQEFRSCWRSPLPFWSSWSSSRCWGG